MDKKILVIVLFILVCIAEISLIKLYNYEQQRHETAERTISLLLTRISTLEGREKQIIEINNDVLTEYSEFKNIKEKEILNQSKDLFFYKQKYYDYFSKYTNLQDQHDRLRMALVEDKRLVIKDGAYLKGIAIMAENYYCIYDKGEPLDEQLYTVIHEWAHFRGYNHNDNESTTKMNEFIEKTAGEYLQKYQT